MQRPARGPTCTAISEHTTIIQSSEILPRSIADQRGSVSLAEKQKINFFFLPDGVLIFSWKIYAVTAQGRGSRICAGVPLFINYMDAVFHNIITAKLEA